MKTNDKKPKLTSYDEIFQTEEERQDQMQEKVMGHSISRAEAF